MSIAVLFCRISSEKQDDGYSLDAQEKHGKQYTESLNLNIKRVFRFVETASKQIIIHYYKEKRIIDSQCSPAEIFNEDIQTAVAKNHETI